MMFISEDVDDELSGFVSRRLAWTDLKHLVLLKVLCRQPVINTSYAVRNGKLRIDTLWGPEAGISWHPGIQHPRR